MPTKPSVNVQRGRRVGDKHEEIGLFELRLELVALRRFDSEAFDDCTALLRTDGHWADDRMTNTEKAVLEFPDHPLCGCGFCGTSKCDSYPPSYHVTMARELGLRHDYENFADFGYFDYHDFRAVAEIQRGLDCDEADAEYNKHYRHDHPVQSGGWRNE
jgi:hypothetical protein